MAETLAMHHLSGRHASQDMACHHAWQKDYAGYRHCIGHGRDATAQGLLVWPQWFYSGGAKALMQDRKGKPHRAHNGKFPRATGKEDF
jgi:hypothetical protein